MYPSDICTYIHTYLRTSDPCKDHIHDSHCYCFNISRIMRSLPTGLLRSTGTASPHQNCILCVYVCAYVDADNVTRNLTMLVVCACGCTRMVVVLWVTRYSGISLPNIIALLVIKLYV